MVSSQTRSRSLGFRRAILRHEGSGSVIFLTLGDDFTKAHFLISYYDLHVAFFYIFSCVLFHPLKMNLKIGYTSMFMPFDLVILIQGI